MTAPPPLLEATLSPRLTEVVALAQELIRRPTVSPPGDEAAAAEVVREYLAGMPAIRVVRSQLSEDRPNLIFSAGRADRRCLVLTAHLDTVRPSPDWAFDPFAADIQDGRLYGLGATDNKGAVAAMACAFKALVETGIEEYGQVVFIANADEERGGHFGMAHVAPRLDPLPDAAIVAEASGLSDSFETLWTAARATSRFRIRTAGSGGHTALSADRESNAIEALVSAMRHIAGELERDEVDAGAGLLELVPVQVAAGTGWGERPESAAAAYDLRVPPGMSRETVNALLETAVDAASSSNGSIVHLEFDDAEGWIDGSSVRTDESIVTAAKTAWTRVFGTQPRTGCFPGGTDARFLSSLGVPTLPALGPGALSRAHRADEYVTVAELEQAARLYTLTAGNFLSEHS